MEDDLAGIWMPLRQSWANFVLFEERNLETDKLKEKGIIAKRFVIGGKKYFRITVRSDWEIDLLLLAAQEISSSSV